MKTFDSFSVWTPFVALEKSTSKPEPMTGRIGGIISTESKDFQGETITQDGVDWSYFMKHGWFNYEHQSGPENVLGHPERVTTQGGQTRVEGVLYLAKSKAKEVFETAVAMSKAGNMRTLGFSVEGQVLAREKKRILKARVLNVAVTAHPVNPDARLEVLSKAFGASVGYQTPAGMGGNITPLIPQSLESVPAIASYGVYAMNRKKLTTQDLALLLHTTFPKLGHGKALSIAVEIARVVGR